MEKEYIIVWINEKKEKKKHKMKDDSHLQTLKICPDLHDKWDVLASPKPLSIEKLHMTTCPFHSVIT